MFGGPFVMLQDLCIGHNLPLQIIGFYIPIRFHHSNSTSVTGVPEVRRGRFSFRCCRLVYRAVIASVSEARFGIWVRSSRLE